VWQVARPISRDLHDSQTQLRSKATGRAGCLEAAASGAARGGARTRPGPAQQMQRRSHHLLQAGSSAPHLGNLPWPVIERSRQLT
jgi:hypothetical protein